MSPFSEIEGRDVLPYVAWSLMSEDIEPPSSITSVDEELGLVDGEFRSNGGHSGSGSLLLLRGSRREDESMLPLHRTKSWKMAVLT